VIRACLISAALFAACLTARAAPVTALVFSPDGTALVSNGDLRIDVRSPKDASIQRVVACDLPRITTLAFAPDERVIAVGGGEPGIRGEVQLLSWPEGKLVHRFGDHADIVTRVEFDPSGKHLAVAASDHSAEIWRIPENDAPALALRLNGHSGPVMSVAFSPTGETVITAGTDRSLKVWATADGRLLRGFGHHTEAIHALAFRPRAMGGPSPVTCASGGDDHTVRVWQPEIGRMVRIVRHHQGPVFALVWSADGTALFSAGKEGIIRRIDGASDSIEAEWRAHTDWIYALALSPDGATLASGDWAGNVGVHSTRRAGDTSEGARSRNR
jgi:WD40 repeat protein